MATELFKMDPRVTVANTMTVVGAATVHEALTKEQVATEGKPANEPRVTAATTGLLCSIRFKPSEALKKRIEEGWKVIELRLETYAENRSTAGKNIKIGFGGNPQEPELGKLLPSWTPFIGVPATEAEVTAHQTVAKLEELEAIYEHKTAKELWLFESYVQVVVESPPEEEEQEQDMLV